MNITIEIPASFLSDAVEGALRREMGNARSYDRTTIGDMLAERVRKAVLDLIASGGLDEAIVVRTKERAATIVGELLDEEITRAARRRVKAVVAQLSLPARSEGEG